MYGGLQLLTDRALVAGHAWGCSASTTSRAEVWLVGGAVGEVWCGVVSRGGSAQAPLRHQQPVFAPQTGHRCTGLYVVV
jgi:hypothetical protein